MTKRVAILGAGPSGLTCAYYLAKKGYEVCLFEKRTIAGGQVVDHKGVDVGALDYFPHRDCQRLFADLEITPVVEEVDARRAYNPNKSKYCMNLRNKLDLFGMGGLIYLNTRAYFSGIYSAIDYVFLTRQHSQRVIKVIQGTYGALWEKVAEKIGAMKNVDLKLSSPVKKILRNPEEVVVEWAGGQDTFDYLVTTVGPDAFQPLFDDSDEKHRRLWNFTTSHPIGTIVLNLDYPGYQGTEVLAFRDKVLAGALINQGKAAIYVISNRDEKRFNELLNEPAEMVALMPKEYGARSVDAVYRWNEYFTHFKSSIFTSPWVWWKMRQAQGYKRTYYGGAWTRGGGVASAVASGYHIAHRYF
ncbi:MAG: FAD-dependent oxidoreductase [Deltaproteobacteria bacterium]|jgi:hypothetical protein|nr:FAD-dependent oxidoreductase [Deltaproteobacteria bacterium]MBT6435749.1 FAD-dependent oxidoreductase [Deltaproteobacteria bacterium]MBT6492335.1 FAD-dependent oxidoreductase [Deltaproteobacteria bacterium]